MTQDNIYTGMSATIKSMFFHPPDEVQDKGAEIDHNNQMIQKEFLKKQFTNLKIEPSIKLTQKMVDENPNICDEILQLSGEQTVRVNQQLVKQLNDPSLKKYSDLVEGFLKITLS